MFRSFYLAGFECATGYNMHGEWIDQIAATEHDLHVDADYDRLAEVDIHAVREAIRWPLVDRGGGRYDFSSVEPFVRAAVRHRFDVIWDMFHYGYPDGVDVFSSAFVDRFAAYCRAAARYVRDQSPGPHYFTPINEASYYSWAAGHAGRFAPHEKNRGIELKINLARACLAGIDAIRSVCPRARIVHADPICYVVPKTSTPAELETAREFNEEIVPQFWDLVSGRVMPELGGRPDALDIVGMNYYWTNQWELGSEGTPLADDDPRRLPLGELVRRTWERYGCDIVITETSERAEVRGPWVHELSKMAEELIEEGVKLRGICLYPILGMPEWHARNEWARMGLWDLEREQDRLERKIVAPMRDALRIAQLRNGAPRHFILSRTGREPLEVHGSIVAHRAERDYEVRLIRGDRLWVADVEVQTEGGPVKHVHTATELHALLDQLRSFTAIDDASSWADALEHFRVIAGT